MNPFIVSVFIAFLWGVTPVIHKYVLKTNVNPYTIMTIGSVAYLIILSIFVYVNQNVIMKDIKTMDWNVILILGAVSIFAGFFANLLYYDVLKNAKNSYIMTTVMYSSPIFTFILATLFLKESFSMYSILGVFLTFSGIALLGMHSKEPYENII